jgi:5-methylcytosine-specific restriction endonuclease McrA
MTYSDLLNHVDWKSKRKEILLRDKSTCLECHNLNLIEGTLIGLLNYSGKKETGIFFDFYGLDASGAPLHQTIYLKKGTYVKPFRVPNQFVAYIDPFYCKKSFGKVIGIRERTTLSEELPRTIFEEKFKQNMLRLENRVFENYEWDHVPSLHVHHTYYQVNLNPWEYPNESLQTLCWICHENLHKKESIPYRDQNGNNLTPLTPCIKCFGAGWFPQYKHIEEGVCFHCRGARYQELF